MTPFPRLINRGLKPYIYPKIVAVLRNRALSRVLIAGVRDCGQQNTGVL
jgi:hypothetical protein